MARVLVLLPARDFDPSEAAVGWRVLANAGHTISFATADGRPAVADEMMLTGKGLDPWGAIPLLRNLPLVGLLMRANRDARKAYAEMTVDPNYVAPQRWDAIDVSAFDALLLPGGHRARGMREYLESEILQRHVASFFDQEKLVAAICHGVLLAARSISKHTKTARGRSRASRGSGIPTTTGLIRSRTGSQRGMSVQQEVTRALARPDDFRDVPKTDPDYRQKTSGLQRDSMDDETPAFVVRDRNYVSARWPGDAHTFAKTLAGMLK